MGDDFVKYARSLDDTRHKVDTLRASKSISQSDCDHFYGGLFLSLYTGFEDLIEDLFIGLLVTSGGYFYPKAGFHLRTEVRSHDVARSLVLGNQRYMTWLPYDRTEQLAKAYFRNGVPFTLLSKPQKDLLDTCRYVRNSLAHRNRGSLDQFRKKVIGASVIPAREQTPTRYLQGVFRITPPQTRYEDFAANLVSVARTLTG